MLEPEDVVLSDYSLSSIVGMIKQLSRVVKTSGDVITVLAKDKTDNPDILEAGKIVSFNLDPEPVKVATLMSFLSIVSHTGNKKRSIAHFIKVSMSVIVL